MNRLMRLTVACGFALLGVPASASTVVLGGNAHGLTGSTADTITAGPLTISVFAGPAGAVLNESNDQGLGVDNRPVAGSTADTGETRAITKLNTIGGSGPLAGTGEFLLIGFDRPGILQHLFFDGLKDETLEYFQLTFPNGTVLTVFDSQTQDKLNDQGFDLADLQVANPTLCQEEDDDLYDLNYRFRAGEAIKITYGEVDYVTLLPTYVPVVPDIANGSRFQGLSVSVVPEPGTLVLSVLAVCTLSCRLATH